MIASKSAHRRGEGRGCDGIALTNHLQATLGAPGNGIALNRGPLRGGTLESSTGVYGIALSPAGDSSSLGANGIALSSQWPPGQVDGIALKPTRGPLREVDGIALKPPKALQREVDGDALKPPKGLSKGVYGIALSPQRGCCRA